jgi:N-acetylneuraminate synthase/N,N'-diacetyllegionaminate synthase
LNTEIQIQDRTINKDSLFVIAEVGNQFNGKLDTALELVDVASDAGADAVKFIFWFPDEIMADKTQMYSYKVWHKFTDDYYNYEETKTEPMYDMLNRLRLTLPEWAEVMARCKQKNIIFMATVNSPSGIDYAGSDGLNIPCIKLSSWDWNFTDLWYWVAHLYKPVIADMGAVTEKEVLRNLKIFEDAHNKDVALLHCYHTSNPAERNMNTVPYIRHVLNCLGGFSSGDYNDEMDITAIANGACILEKRLTLSRNGGVLHDAVSKEPDEFKKYVRTMREVKESLGNYEIKPSGKDLEERKKWFRRVVADQHIHIGETITRDMLECKRGETGISPEFVDHFLGKKSKREINKNESLTMEDV